MSNQAKNPGFINQIAASKQSVGQWDGWMQKSATTASASLPSTGVRSPATPTVVPESRGAAQPQKS